MADAAMREVVYEIVTRVVAPADLGPSVVERHFKGAVRILEELPPTVRLKVEKVRVVSMYAKREATDVAQAG